MTDDNLTPGTWRLVTLYAALTFTVVLGIVYLLTPPLAGALTTLGIFVIATLLSLRPYKTVAGTRTLRTRRKVTSPATKDPITAIALHGRCALLDIMPDFAQRDGLLDGGRLPEYGHMGRATGSSFTGGLPGPMGGGGPF